MSRYACLLGAIGAAAMLVGCAEPTPGRTRSLGVVDYGLAFAKGREVMKQHFGQVASADADAGVIRMQPKAVQGDPDRLLGSSSEARQVAVMRLRRSKEEVFAHVSVALQRRGTAPLRQMYQPEEPYSSVPHDTPANVDAATTTEQNEVWTVQRYLHDVELRVLEDLYGLVQPEKK